MKYMINIGVNTKATDIYDQVAINKFPLVISCSDDNRLKEVLANDKLKNYIKENISKYLYDEAKYYIVKMGPNDQYEKLNWSLKDITKINYE